MKPPGRYEEMLTNTDTPSTGAVDVLGRQRHWEDRQLGSWSHPLWTYRRSHPSNQSTTAILSSLSPIGSPNSARIFLKLLTSGQRPDLEVTQKETFRDAELPIGQEALIVFTSPFEDLDHEVSEVWTQIIGRFQMAHRETQFSQLDGVPQHEQFQHE